MRRVVAVLAVMLVALAACRERTPSERTIEPNFPRRTDIVLPPHFLSQITRDGPDPPSFEDQLRSFLPIPPLPVPPVATYDLKLAQAIVVGALRVDGTLIPFATFDGRVWENYWPQPEYGVPADKDQLTGWPGSSSWWGEHPVVNQWWFFGRNATPVSVAVSGMTVVESSCGVNPALTTDFVNPTPFEVFYAGAENAGIAVSAAEGVLPVDRIDVGDPRAEEFVGFVRQLFQEKEIVLWSSKGIGPDRFKRPVRITSAAASGLPDGRTLIAFRAERYVEDTGRTVVNGWIRQDSQSRFTVHEVNAFEGDPDGKGEVKFHPETVLTLQGHVFWIGRTSGYESNGYVVIDVGRPETTALLHIDAGGC